MTHRLRLPAYGKQLLEARRAGQHPLVVHVVYGDRFHHGTRCDNDCSFTEPREHPCLSVRPAEFKPGTVDWHVVTGCLVAVFDHRDDPLRGSRQFYEMLGELGRFAGPVQTYRLAPHEQRAADTWAWRWEFCWAAHVIARDMGAPPSWWPEETERKNGERRKRWADVWAAREQREPVAA